MKSRQLQWLACPHCGSNVAVEHGNSRVLQEAILRCDQRHRSVVKRGIARFISEKDPHPADDTVLHAELDSVSGGRYWHDRFATVTGFPIDLLAGKKVLELGCGVGRYTEWMARYAEHVVAVEPSSRVEVARQSAGGFSNVTVVQGEIDKPPVKGPFDVVMMLDGLLGTENPAQALRAAARLVKRGGTVYVAVPRRGALLAPALELTRKTLRILPSEVTQGAARAYARTRLGLGTSRWTKRWLGFGEESLPTANQLACRFLSIVQADGPAEASNGELAKWIGPLRIEGRTRHAVALRKRVVEVTGVPARDRAAGSASRGRSAPVMR